MTINPCYLLKKEFDQLMQTRNGGSFPDSIDIETLEPKKLLEFKERLSEKMRFYNIYKQKVRALLEKWAPGNHLSNRVQFDSLGRVSILDDLFVVNKSYFPSLIRQVEGMLDMTKSENLHDLSHLYSVTGNLVAAETSLKNLHNLRFVGGDLDVSYTDIADLSNLHWVGGSFYGYEDLQITEIPQLERVEEDFYCSHSSYQQFADLREIGRAVYLCGFDLECFRELFPRLESVGKNPDGNSFYVSSEKDKQILLSYQGNSLDFDGEIRVLRPF